MRVLWITLLIAVPTGLGGCVTPLPVTFSEDRVDLRGYWNLGLPSASGEPQLIRDQGARNTCTTFAAIAALEAAYYAAGYGALDLSEEFINHMGKMMSLHVPWTDYRNSAQTESQVALFSGGGSLGHLYNIVEGGWRVPAESSMPYNYVPGSMLYDERRYSAAQLMAMRTLQYKAGDFNLNPQVLRPSALAQQDYYGARGLHFICDPFFPGQQPCDRIDVTTAIEAALRRGRAVSFDALVSNRTNGPIWHHDPDRTPEGGHAMLVVGFDRTDPDPDNHYFIVKNSWNATVDGGSGGCGEDGFTCMGYDFMRARTYAAGYITDVARPRDWPELGFLGRWALRFPHGNGTLDLYHLPGAWQHMFDVFEETGVRRNDTVVDVPPERDRRVGTFIDARGNTFRVNGAIDGNLLTLYIDDRTPLLRWGQFRGNITVLRLLDDDADYMAGYSGFGLFGARGGAVATRLPTAVPAGYFAPEPTGAASYVARWDAVIDGREGQLEFEAVVDGTLQGALVLEGRRLRATATVPATDPERLRISVESLNGTWTLNGQSVPRPDFRTGRDSWGLVAGMGVLPAAEVAGGRFTDPDVGFFLKRLVGEVPDLEIYSPLTVPNPRDPRVPILHVNRGDSVTFRATARDHEDGNLDAQIYWASGQGSEYLVAADRPGPELTVPVTEYGDFRIQARVLDSDGFRRERFVQVEVENQPPRVWIESPTTKNVLYEETPITFRANSIDPNEIETGRRLPVGAYNWSMAGSTLEGQDQTLTLSRGTYTVVVDAWDGGGLRGTANMTIVVHPGSAPPTTAPSTTFAEPPATAAAAPNSTTPAPTPTPTPTVSTTTSTPSSPTATTSTSTSSSAGSAPKVAILEPVEKQGFAADNYHQAGGYYYANVKLAAQVSDPDNDVTSVEWSTSSSVQSGVLGSSASMTAQLRGQSCKSADKSAPHLLTVRVKDAMGHEATAEVSIEVASSCK